MKAETTTIVLIDDKLSHSIMADTYTIFSFVVMIGLGVYLQSAAMQWIGGLLFLAAMFSRGSKRIKRLSESDAIEYLTARKSEKTA